MFFNEQASTMQSSGLSRKTVRFGGMRRAPNNELRQSRSSSPSQSRLLAESDPQRRPRASGEGRPRRTRNQAPSRDIGPRQSQQVHHDSSRFYGKVTLGLVIVGQAMLGMVWLG